MPTIYDDILIETSASNRQFRMHVGFIFFQSMMKYVQFFARRYVICLYVDDQPFGNIQIQPYGSFHSLPFIMRISFYCNKND